MAPHLHTSSASKSTTTGGQTGSGRTTRSGKITNTEKTVNSPFSLNSPFAGSSSEAEAVRITNLDPQIHTADIAPFAKFALEEKVRELANRSGFQPDVIRVVYKHSRTFKQAENITESMRAAAVKCAVAKIKRVMLYGTEDGGEDEGTDEDKE